MWSSFRSLLKPQLFGRNITESVLGSKTYSTGSFPALSSRLTTVKFLQPWRRESNEEIICSNPNEVVNYIQSRGMKIKGRVKRRCKDCQMEWKDGVLYNFCATSPRHKQMMVQQYWPNLRILTHASQSVKKPYAFKKPHIAEQPLSDVLYQYQGRNPRYPDKKIRGPRKQINTYN